MEQALPRLQLMEKEIMFWRKNMLAIAWSAACSINADLDKGDRDDAVHTHIMILQPALRLLESIEKGDLDSECCVGCGKPLINGQLVHTYEEGEHCHADCRFPDATKAQLAEMLDRPLSDEEDGAVSAYDDGFGPADMVRMLWFARDAAKRMEAE